MHGFPSSARTCTAHIVYRCSRKNLLFEYRQLSMSLICDVSTVSEGGKARDACVEEAYKKNTGFVDVAPSPLRFSSAAMALFENFRDAGRVLGEGRQVRVRDTERRARSGLNCKWAVAVAPEIRRGESQLALLRGSR